MFQGWLNFGCVEIANAARAYGQAIGSQCPANWFTDPEADSLADAFNDGQPYDALSLQAAPWFDEDDPVSGRFFGVMPVNIDGVENSSRTANVLEGIADGGDVTGYRYAAKTVTVKVYLLARGQDALDYGLDWLSAAVEPDTCGMHGGSCGEADMQFLSALPPDRAEGEDELVYEEKIHRLTRVLHGVTCIAGPIIQERHHRNGVFGYTVQLVFNVATPGVFTLPRVVTTQTGSGSVVQDIPYNLAKYPSADLEGDAVVVGTNLAPNPSIETNTTGWGASAGVVSGTNPTSLLTAVRSGDLAAAGAYSLRVRLLGDSVAASGTAVLNAAAVVPIPAQPAGTRLSFSLWSAAIVAGGSSVSVIQALSAYALFNDTAATRVELGATTTPSEYGGRVFSMDSVAIPAGATSVTVVAGALVNWASGTINSDIRLYADALAVTIP